MGLIALVTVANGQANTREVAAARRVMTYAMQDLAEKPAFALILQGESGGNDIDINTYVRRIGDITQIEIGVWENREMTQHIIADGETLWGLNVRANTFVGYEYRTQPEPLKFVTTQLAAMLRGKGNVIPRFLDDIFFRTSNRQWQPFLTLGEPYIDWEVGKIEFVRGNVKGKPAEEMLYCFESFQEFGSEENQVRYGLNNVYFRQREQTVKGVVETAWSIDIFRKNFVPKVKFKFIPPKGARAVSVGKPITKD